LAGRPVVQVGGVAAATGTGGRDTQPHPGTSANAGAERGEVTAYQDGVWLGRAIVPVDVIARARRRRSGTKWSD
jgi:hypothetical protein